MKRNIVITSIALSTIAAVAFGYNNWMDTPQKVQEKNTPSCKAPQRIKSDINGFLRQSAFENFSYAVGSRFINHVTKEKLQKAKTISGIVPDGAADDVREFWDVRIKLLDEKTPEAKAKDDQLTEDQLKLIQTFDYSSNFSIEAFCMMKNHETGEYEKQCFVYYMTVIPEKYAEYNGGNQAFIDYLKHGSKEETEGVKRKDLQPGKIRFTVLKNGTIADVELESTSGDKKVDDKMMELVNNSPNKWTPAQNMQGEKIDQVMVYSFGLIGC